MKLLVFLTLLSSLCSLHAQKELVREVLPDGSSIALILPLGCVPAGGFASVRVEMENKTAKDVSWNLSTASTTSNYNYYGPRRSDGSSKVTSSFGVSCPAGSTRQVELLVPIHQANENGVYDRNVRISGRSSSYPEFELFAYFDGSSSFRSPTFSISSELQNLGNPDLMSVLRDLEDSSRRGGVKYGIFSPGQLPQDWRAYAGFDVLLFSVNDSKSLSPGVALALQQWVQSGGRMMILNPGDESIPESTEFLGFGSRQVVNVGVDFSKVAPTLLGLGDRQSEVSQARVAGRGYATRGWMPGNELGSRSMHSSLLILALIIFAIIVGPINLFVWANRTRRHRLFFTTPVISLAASLILVVIIIFQDGFGGDGARAIAVDVGGPDSTSASIVQEQFSRAGILFSSGFTLDDNSMMVPVSPPVTDYNRADSKSFTGDFSYSAETVDDGWKISGDWFSSRTEQAQVIRSVIPSRERLELIGDSGGAPRLSSTFSYPLVDVYYCDAVGKVWKAASIDSGETVTLEPSFAVDRDEGLEPLVSRFSNHRQSNLRTMIERKNSFAASASRAPSVSTLASIDWQESPALITGLLSK